MADLCNVLISKYGGFVQAQRGEDAAGDTRYLLVISVKAGEIVASLTPEEARAVIDALQAVMQEVTSEQR